MNFAIIFITIVAITLNSYYILHYNCNTNVFTILVSPARVPPYWGAMKYLNQKIPEVASRKSETLGYLVEQEK